MAGLSRANGASANNAVVKSVKDVLKRFAEAVRRAWARITGKEYAAKSEAMSDSDVLGMLTQLHRLNVEDAPAKGKPKPRSR